MGLAQTPGAPRPDGGGGSPSPNVAEHTGGEALTTEERAIVAACNADETWRALRGLSPEGKDKLLSAMRHDTRGSGRQRLEREIQGVGQEMGGR